jgi:hypothetical protein
MSQFESTGDGDLAILAISVLGVSKSILALVLESNSQAAIRLRNEAAVIEQQAKHLLNISVLIGSGRLYDDAVGKARAMLAKAEKSARIGWENGD